jgi:hypothetical protein
MGSGIDLRKAQLSFNRPTLRVTPPANPPFKPARGPLCIAWEFSSPGQLTVGAYLSLTLTFSHPPFTLIPLTCHSFIRRHPAACQLDRPLPAGGHPATNYLPLLGDIQQQYIPTLAGGHPATTYLPLLGDIQQLHTSPCWGTSSNYIPTLAGGHPATTYLPLLGDIQQLHTYPCWGTSSNYIVPTLAGGHSGINYQPLLGDIQQIITYPCWGTSSS